MVVITAAGRATQPSDGLGHANQGLGETIDNRALSWRMTVQLKLVAQTTQIKPLMKGGLYEPLL